MNQTFSRDDMNERILRERCSISLNNVGVSLLQRRCYMQAVEALECAASLMPNSLLDASDKMYTNDLLRKNLQYLTTAKPARCEALIIEVLSVTPDGYLTLESDNNSCRRTVLESVFLDAPCPSVAHAVRLESHYVPKQEAIATHNLAIACLCLAKVFPVTNEKRYEMKKLLFEKATQYARLSATVLLEHWQSSVTTSECPALENGEENECQDVTEWLNHKIDGSPAKNHHGILDGITVGVINVFLTTLQETSRTEEAKELYNQLVDFRESAFDNSEQQCQALLKTILRSGGLAAAA
ncbi:hypothetical protein FisN_8Lh375 [Fistulifera solaris]|uniref:Uncharacterized protein n=1 Tax=Fistulifera solaris TaxID=1519565 RepID=A0A1Z5JNA3_FISSO|nr:hypothetical protein FisN_8Lh375 [Fistulifera solaris]|eukprot:GAX15332.1 hypothetical protein FisN_8Lh375 [Fistulifera solaris]